MPTPTTEPEMEWWQWTLVVLAVLALLAVLVAFVQSRRRKGGVRPTRR